MNTVKYLMDYNYWYSLFIPNSFEYITKKVANENKENHLKGQHSKRVLRLT